MTLQDQSVVQYPSTKSAPPSDTKVPVTPDGKITFDIEIAENDVRGRQFACRLVLRNGMSNAVDVLAIDYRLGSGVMMERSDNTSFFDLKREYDQLRADVKLHFRIMSIACVDGFSKEYAKKFLDAVRSQFTFQNLFMTLFYMFTRGFRIYVNQGVQSLQRMDFPVTSAQTARKILQDLEKAGIKVPGGVDELVVAKIDRMEAIEQIDPNFVRPEFVTQILPGDNFERVFILKAKRNLSSIASYTAAFDVKLAWQESTRGSDRHAERIMSRTAAFNVTPSPTTLSFVAAVFSFFGVLLNTSGSFVSAKKEAKDVITPASLMDAFYNGSFILNALVAVLLSIILFNSLEMTDLKDKVRSISWRSAMLIGALCGLLSDKMLKAIMGFVGG